MLPESLAPLVAAHQPNFFPWLGYFHKIRWADTFVILDDVAIQRRQSGTVTNRVAFAQGGKEIYMTAPITRQKDGTALSINKVELAQSDFRQKLVAFLKHNYARAAFAGELMPEIIALVENPTPLLGVYNETAIRRIAALLELETPLVPSSTLDVQTTSTQRLIDIVKKLGGKTYLSGSGAGGYQEDDLYLGAGLHLAFQTFAPTPYPRGREQPMTGLSIIDALLHLGTKATRELLEQPLDASKVRVAPNA